MEKFNIKKGREKLSDQEIDRHMNFDKFMSAYKPFKALISKGIILNSIIASTAGIIVLTGYLMYRSGKNEISARPPFINPPVKTMDLRPQTYALNTTNDTTVISSTGSLINLPSGAFVDKDGNDIKGSVEIRYREFHDPIEIMLSGIPMNYDSAGKYNVLESAGMFEIKAYQNNRPIFLKAGKELSVNMISGTNNPRDYNIYFLDTLKRQWNYVCRNTEMNNTCMPVFERNPELEKEFQADQNFVNLNKPVLPKKANPNTYNFVIDFKKDEFPELAVYTGLKFEPMEGKRKFHESLAQKVWEDVLIEKQGDSDQYTVTFTSGKESHSIKVIPVVDEKNYAATIRDYEKRQNRYLSLLAERNKNTEAKRDSLYRIKSIFTGKAASSDLNERFNNFITGNFTGASRDLLAYRTFTVSKLGIWNSDSPLNYMAIERKDTCKTEFVSSDKEPIEMKSVYLISRKVNSIYTVSEQNVSHFFINKEKVDIMVGVSYTGELFYMKDEELKDVIPKDKTVRFKMHKITEKVVNAAQLEDLLKI